MQHLLLAIQNLALRLTRQFSMRGKMGEKKKEGEATALNTKAIRVNCENEAVHYSEHIQ